MTMHHRSRPAISAARGPRCDAGAVRFTGGDIAGLVLAGDMYGAPYDLLAAAMGVSTARVRSIMCRWRRAGVAETGVIGPGPAWCWLTAAGMRAAGFRLGVDVPRDGGLAALLAEARSPAPRFAVVMCEDIARSGRDTYNALRLEKELSAAGIPLLAADEPIDIAGTSATTLLVRRMKQSVAEWYRYEVKEKSAAGFREHTRDGYNVGTVPYRYAADKLPPPVPSKAAQGRTKTRLVPDPQTAPVVEQIYAWRITGGLGAPTIAARLNADPAAYPPPGKSGCWQDATVSKILANPKYTGYMVYGRTTSKNGKRGHRTSPDQWLWSPEPAHPPIITRATWDAAQAAPARHRTSRDTPGLASHPQARTVHALRGIITCSQCGRRMTGCTKTSRNGKSRLYYRCPHNPGNPPPRRRRTRPPHHPGPPGTPCSAPRRILRHPHLRARPHQIPRRHPPQRTRHHRPQPPERNKQTHQEAPSHRHRRRRLRPRNRATRHHQRPCARHHRAPDPHPRQVHRTRNRTRRHQHQARRTRRRQPGRTRPRTPRPPAQARRPARPGPRRLPARPLPHLAR